MKTTNKVCTRCNEVKPLDSFYKNKGKAIARCKVCTIAVSRSYDEVHKEEASLRKRTWDKNNRDKANSFIKNWKKNNRHKVSAANAKRRAAELQAVTSWSEFSEIQDIYLEAHKLEAITGDKYHIDHIIPLQGINVCGLHVIANLSILEASENLSKSNKF